MSSQSTAIAHGSQRQECNPIEQPEDYFRYVVYLRRQLFDLKINDFVQLVFDQFTQLTGAATPWFL